MCASFKRIARDDSNRADLVALFVCSLPDFHRVHLSGTRLERLNDSIDYITNKRLQSGCQVALSC